MRYIPLNNQPNVSETRSQSISPSLRMDDRGFPHIAWLSVGQNINQVNYSFWDGLKWAFYDLPEVYISQEDIIFSPNSLILNSTSNPFIVFSRKIEGGSRLSVASYVNSWSFNNIDVNYEVGWIGIVNLKTDYNNSSSSSSVSVSTSSSSSMNGIDYFVVTYDSDNTIFKVYSVNVNGWTLLGSKSAILDDFSMVRIDMAGRKIGISFVYDSDVIKYNFIDIDTGNWSFINFTNMSVSQLYGELLDMDMAGYYEEGISTLAFAWISRTSNTSYVCGELCLEDGTEIPINNISTVVENQTIDVITDESYVVNGYRKIALQLDTQNFPRIIVAGSTFRVFTLILVGVIRLWLSDVVDISGISNGIVPLSLRLSFSSMTFSSDSGDIYYFVIDGSGYSDVSDPDMVLLNDKWAYHSVYSDGKLSGLDMDGTYKNTAGGILRDSDRPLLITSNLITPVTTTTTTLP